MLVCGSRKRKQLPTCNISPTLNNEPVSQVNNIKYLGCTVDDNLSFKIHFDKTVAKLNRANGVLRRVSPYIPISTRKNLYNTLALPHLDYCSNIWSNMPKTYIQRMQRIQNRSMRIILDAHPRSHSKDLLRECNFMSVNQRFFYNRCTLMWKIVHTSAPEHLTSNFSLVGASHHHNTRSASKHNIFLKRSSSSTFQFQGSRAWNKLPSNIQSITSVQNFKSKCIPFIKNNICTAV